MRIALDMDEVLVDFVEGLLSVWNMEHGTSIRRDDVRSWTLEETFGPGTHSEICAVLSRPRFFADLTPRAGAVSAVRELQAAGHDIALVTHVAPEVGEQAYAGKRECVARHLPMLEPRDLFFVSRKGWIDAHVLVDDAVHNLEDWAIGYGRTGGILLDAPWNRGIRAGRLFGLHAETRRVRRAHSWQDVLAHIAQIKPGS